MPTANAKRPPLWSLALLFVCAWPLVAVAQEKPKAEVEERDLGDGFRAVSVNGGPPAIIDDTTGLIFKEIKGRPAIVDREAGAILFLNDNGEPLVKHYGDKRGGAPDGQKIDPKKLARMKAYMTRVKEFSKDMEKGREARKKRGAKRNPTKPKESLLDRTLKLLNVEGEVAEAIRPILASILTKQDEIRRSSVDLAHAPLGKANLDKQAPRTTDLPAPIQTFLRAFHASLKDPADTAQNPLAKALPGYRAARKKQDAQLAALRETLREVLTVLQEAKLTAVGVLD